MLSCLRKRYEMAVELRTFGRCAENAGKCLTFGRWERSAGRWNATVWCSGSGTAFTHLRKVCEKCGKVPHLRKVGKVRWEVERGSMVLWRRYYVYSPSEGVRKMRESASPSEGGKGLLGGGTRLYGVLEAVLCLRTFGRCAENAGKCLTFGRWKRSAGRWNAAVWCSGGCAVFTHLRKVCGKCGKVSHLRKVG